jgi:uncharacterized protein
VKFSRQLRYYYWRFIRLRGNPEALALGMALGIFSGLMPIVPFQIALAVFLALLFGGSKITAALGTWVSNPLNWYFVYYLDYRIGAAMLGLPRKNRGVASVMDALQLGEEGMAPVKILFETGGSILAAFVLGGLILGLVLAGVSYPLFLKIFRGIHRWRENRRTLKALSRKSG